MSCMKMKWSDNILWHNAEFGKKELFGGCLVVDTVISHFFVVSVKTNHVLNPSWCLSVWNPHVLPVHAWILSGYLNWIKLVWKVDG